MPDHSCVRFIPRRWNHASLLPTSLSLNAAMPKRSLGMPEILMPLCLASRPVMYASSTHRNFTAADARSNLDTSLVGSSHRMPWQKGGYRLPGNSFRITLQRPFLYTRCAFNSLQCRLFLSLLLSNSSMKLFRTWVSTSRSSSAWSVHGTWAQCLLTQ
ncbi:hypothetical protein E2C01_032591 [Portunus trituberculatus]|uniref:Uncharacterized protein n=1 Tax=Portunus trituberculatus TaxID=210409 RepID=A0A5B7EWD3_PORTR|nr:hypothetical protein [Portunus trituberculatus]